MAKAAFASAAPAPVSPFAEEDEDDNDTPVNLSEADRDPGSWSFVCVSHDATHIFSWEKSGIHDGEQHYKLHT